VNAGRAGTAVARLVDVPSTCTSASSMVLAGAGAVVLVLVVLVVGTVVVLVVDVDVVLVVVVDVGATTAVDANEPAPVRLHVTSSVWLGSAMFIAVVETLPEKNSMVAPTGAVATKVKVNGGVELGTPAGAGGPGGTNEPGPGIVRAKPSNEVAPTGASRFTVR
jgi:hypothetical protein